LGSGLENLKIVPAGLYYTEKREFRSSVLLYFGEPFGMPPLANIGTPTEPDRLAVRALTERMKEALDEVTLQAEHADALKFIERAERIFTAGHWASPIPSHQRETLPWASRKLRRRFILERQFMARYQQLRKEAPDKVTALEEKIRGLEGRLARVGLKPEDLLSPDATRPQSIVQGLVLALLRLLALPLVTLGIASHYAVYRLIGVLSIRFAKQDDDLISTVKMLAAMALYPLSWIIIACICAPFLGPFRAILVLLLIPVCGYVALLFIESAHADLGRARALWLLIRQGSQYQELRAEQLAVRELILSMER
jgi:hypothetical protein